MATGRRIFTIISTLILTVVLLSGCTGKITTTTTPATSNWYQETVKQFKALQPTEVPANLTTDGLKTGGEFDVNSYFSVLTHLSMEEGYVLDYIYLYGVTAGGPILYVRKANDAPFKNYEEYRAATHETPKPYNEMSLIWLVKGQADQKAGNKIKTDGTPEGYFEYALLQTLGNQFYLIGGSQANDKRLVCEKAELEKIFMEIHDAGLNAMDPTFKKNARALALEPVIEVTNGVAVVQFIVFTKWGGFFNYGVMVYDNYPHTMLSYATDEVLLKYDSGLRY